MEIQRTQNSQKKNSEKEQNWRTNTPFNLYFYLASLYNVKKLFLIISLIGTSTFCEEFRFNYINYSSVDIDIVETEPLISFTKETSFSPRANNFIYLPICWLCFIRK